MHMSISSMSKMTMTDRVLITIAVKYLVAWPLSIFWIDLGLLKKGQLGHLEGCLDIVLIWSYLIYNSDLKPVGHQLYWYVYDGSQRGIAILYE